MTTEGRQSKARLVVALIFLAALARFAILFMWTPHPPDMSGFYMSGWLYAHGLYDLIYATPDYFFGGTPPDWMEPLEQVGLYGNEVLPYVYAPLWAAVLSPIAGATDPLTFFRVFDVVLVGLMVASVFVAWRLARRWAIPLWGWTALSTVALATSVTAYIALAQLQPQIVVAFLCLVAFERYGAGKPVAAGICLAFAAALKLTPAGLALIFLLDRNWRALGAFAVVGLLLAGLSLIIAGPDLHFAYLDSLMAAGQGIHITAVTYNIEVLLQAISSALGFTPAFDPWQRGIRLLETPFLMTVVSKALLLAALVWMVRATAALPSDKRLVARLFLLSMLLALFGPLGWAHYYLLPLFLLPSLIGLLPVRLAGWTIAAFLVVASWPVMLGVALTIPGDFARAAIGTLTMLTLFAITAAGCARQGQTRSNATVADTLAAA
ncbi:glycosyltransferase family 87 protein [Pseudoruegeria sp. HB172150]|uniref:glycosyltransferase family 87 protein n=1 Tax=Pseudoruegeria sp. HB172150 TaxID=2721164 RepID=UPI0015537882|nr:glycosyltransferase family 87 protein [Pseudoruegeria sp. HB172150]